jgi:predicted DNA-binding transcriptional regulator AlpA
MGSKPNIIEPLAPLLTKQQVAAFLNVRPRTVDRFRRDDKCFPQPRWLSDGTPRWLPHELHNWVNSRKRGGVAPAWQRHHQQQQRRRRRKRERK